MQRNGGESRRASRRRMLARLGSVVGAGVLAGCDGDGGDGTVTGSATSTATPVPDDWAEGGPPEREGWQVTFHDRFEGGELDTDRWSYGMGGATLQCPTHDAPNHCWAEDHAWVDAESDRLLLQTSDEDPEGEPDYTMGAVASDPHFVQEHGYFEAKVRMPATTGTLCSFWMLSDFDEHRYRELTFEARGNENGEVIHHGYYVQDDEGTMHEPSQGPADQWGTNTGGIDPPLDEAFHVLGIEWRPEYVAYHIDGEEVQRWDDEAIAEYFPDAPMYLILSHGVMEGGQWVGWPHLADFPSHQAFEWVRAWQHEEYL